LDLSQGGRLVQNFLHPFGVKWVGITVERVVIWSTFCYKISLYYFLESFFSLVDPMLYGRKTQVLVFVVVVPCFITVSIIPNKESFGFGT